MESFKNSYVKRTRILTHSLIISGTLNFALIATFATFVLKERKGVLLPPSQKKDSVQQMSTTNNEVFSQYFFMSYENLIKELYDISHIEHGYRRCDLALSCLTAFYYFDLERALSEFSIEKRDCTFLLLEEEKQVSITLFPGLMEGQFQTIRNFIKTEVWPLTPIGLYNTLCSHSTCPNSLKEALLLTPQVFSLKKHLHQMLSDDDIMELLRYSKWSDIEHFSSISDFLLSCINKGSKLAAGLLVQLEKEFALKNLNNEQMKQLLTVLKDVEKTPPVIAFLNKVSTGIRPDNIREYNKERASETQDQSIYTVQYGDSLWKISRTFDMNIDTLRELNNLESDSLIPGTTLIVLPMKD